MSDIRSWASTVTVILPIIRILLGAEPYHPDDKEWYRYTIKASKLFSDGKIHLGWYWEGDGTLIFIEGDKMAINTDCKCDYYWDWVKEE